MPPFPKKNSHFAFRFLTLSLAIAVTLLFLIAVWGFNQRNELLHNRPQKYVDLAMQIPGAIVLTPHRNLVEMGIAPLYFEKMFVGGPAIAVPTKGQWCIWSLGAEGGSQGGIGWSPFGGMSTRGLVMIGSMYGYSIGFNALKECVEQGNKSAHAVDLTAPMQNLRITGMVFSGSWDE